MQRSRPICRPMRLPRLVRFTVLQHEPRRRLRARPRATRLAVTARHTPVCPLGPSASRHLRGRWPSQSRWSVTPANDGLVGAAMRARAGKDLSSVRLNQRGRGYHAVWDNMPCGIPCACRRGRLYREALARKHVQCAHADSAAPEEVVSLRDCAAPRVDGIAISFVLAGSRLVQLA